MPLIIPDTGVAVTPIVVRANPKSAWDEGFQVNPERSLAPPTKVP